MAVNFFWCGCQFCRFTVNFFGVAVNFFGVAVNFLWVRCQFFLFTSSFCVLKGRDFVCIFVM